MNKTKCRWKVKLYRLERSDLYGDRHAYLRTFYTHARTENGAIKNAKHQAKHDYGYDLRSYDNSCGSESVSYVFEATVDE